MNKAVVTTSGYCIARLPILGKNMLSVRPGMKSNEINMKLTFPHYVNAKHNWVSNILAVADLLYGI